MKKELAILFYWFMQVFTLGATDESKQIYSDAITPNNAL